MGSSKKKSAAIEKKANQKPASSSQPLSKNKPSAPATLPPSIQKKVDKKSSKKKDNTDATKKESKDTPADSMTKKQRKAPNQPSPQGKKNKLAASKTKSHRKPDSDEEADSSSAEDVSGSEEVSSSEEEEEKEEKSKAAAIKSNKNAKWTSSESESEGDNDSDEDVELSCPKTNGKSASKKQSEGSADDSEDSSSDSSSDEPAEKTKPATTTKAASKTKTNGKASESPDDSSSDAESSSGSEDDDEESTNDGSSDSDESDSDEDEVPTPATTDAGPTREDKKRKSANTADASSKKAKSNGKEDGISNIYVGGLSWNVDNEWFKKEFESCGPIVDAKVITDRMTQKSKGFGYIQFETCEAAQKAVDTMNGVELDGRTLKVDLSAPKAERPATTEGKKDFSNGQLSEPSTTLFVGNLPFSASQDTVWETFAEFGGVISVRLPTEPETQRPKGFGYVECESLEMAQSAVDKARGDGIFVEDRQLRLDFSQPRSGGNDRGGGRGGFGNRGGRGGGFRGGGRGFGDRGGRGFGGGRGGRGFGDRGRGGGRGASDQGWNSRAKVNGSVMESAGVKKKFE